MKELHSNLKNLKQWNRTISYRISQDPRKNSIKLLFILVKKLWDLKQWNHTSSCRISQNPIENPITSLLTFSQDTMVS